MCKAPQLGQDICQPVFRNLASPSLSIIILSSATTGALMGRIGKTYPRSQAGEMPIIKGRLLFLSPREAIRHQLRRAEPLVWVFLIIGLIGAFATLGL
jgi:hypothetical protein